MNQKQKLLTMMVMLGLSFLWMFVVLPNLSKKYNWKYGADAPTTPVTSVTPPASSPASGPTTGTGGNPTTSTIVAVKAATQPASVVIGSTEYDPDPKHPKSLFPLGVTINNRGASIESVTLNRFRQQYDQPKPYVFQKAYDVSSPLAAALATRWVSIDGSAAQPLGNVYWESVAPATGPSTGQRSTASFSLDLNDAAGKPRLRITKTYEIHDKADKTAGYEFVVSHTVSNLTGAPMKVKLGFNGTTAPKSENSRDLPEVIAGFDGGRKNVVIEHTAVGGVKVEKPLDVKAMKTDPLVWSGMSSAYFDAIVRTTDLTGKPTPLSQVKAILLNPDVQDTMLHAVALDYETGELDVPANGSSSFAMNVYAGPKSRDIVKNDYYALYPMSYDETLVLSGGICAFCTWPWLINLLVLLLQGFHFLLHDWGLAIIALVCLVRLILHPITKRSQISMSRMTKMGPEMERLKAKHKDEPEALKKAQMEFYREQGVAPFLGCLPMFLQMPIWIALWSSLQSTFEIRHALFLNGFTWIKDLSQPDRLIHLHEPIKLWMFGDIDAFNILPVLMAVVFYIQQKFQPQPVAATPEQQQQQKMMKWMSIFLFPLFLYKQPSGLNLYIFTSTLIGIFESKRIRDHIKERDEKEKAGVVLIDGEPGRRDDLAGGGVRRVRNDAPPKPPGMVAGFMAKLQTLAEDAKKQQETKLKKGKK